MFSRLNVMLWMILTQHQPRKVKENTLSDQFEGTRAKNKASREQKFIRLEGIILVAVLEDLG